MSMARLLSSLGAVAPSSLEVSSDSSGSQLLPWSASYGGGGEVAAAGITCCCCMLGMGRKVPGGVTFTTGSYSLPLMMTGGGFSAGGGLPRGLVEVIGAVGGHLVISAIGRSMTRGCANLGRSPGSCSGNRAIADNPEYALESLPVEETGGCSSVLVSVIGDRS